MKNIFVPMILEPQYRDYIWGGARLKPGFAPIAEAWVVYEHNKILNGIFNGKTLSAAAAESGLNLMGEKIFSKMGSRFPLLIKLLDCAQWLSLQVHPSDEKAIKLEGVGQFGKTEAWYFIEAAAGAEILCGLKAKTSQKVLEESIRGHKLLDQMERIPVKTGDSIFIPAGMIHALGPGLLVYEVQQSSDWTYRVWDWDRPASPARQLHIEKSIAAADAALTGKLNGQVTSPTKGRQGLINCPYFNLSLIKNHPQPVLMDTACKTFHSLTVIEGSAQIEGENWQIPLNTFQTALVPADAEKYQITLEGQGKILCAQAEAD